MMIPKSILLPLVKEVNSKPCPYCGKMHIVKISSIPVVYLEGNDESCALWDRDIHERAMRIVENFRKGTLL